MTVLGNRSHDGGTRRAMFVSLDGLEDPLGRSQILPYVAGLASRGHSMDLVTFEKPGVPARFRSPIEEGIRWTSIPYIKRPWAVLNPLALAGIAPIQAVASRTDLIHARSLGMAGLAMVLAGAFRIPFLCDSRGFWFDEKADTGTLVLGSPAYRALKQIERASYNRAAAITVLTENARRYLHEEYMYAHERRAPIHLIPTCADSDAFTPDGEQDAELKHAFENTQALVYVGSMGTWYLADEMARFYLAFRTKVANPRFLVVTRDSAEPIANVLRAAGVEHELVVRSAKRDRVPGLLRLGVAGISFIRSTFSKRASAATKMGEYLASGLPVVANDIGDVRRVLSEPGAGVHVEPDDDFEQAAAALVACMAAPERAMRARQVALRWFSLETALDDYDALYRSMPDGSGATSSLPENVWPKPTKDANP